MISLLAASLLLSLQGSPPPKAAERPVVYAWFPRNVNDWDTGRIDWSVVTHLCLRAVVLQPDGTIKPGWKAENIPAVVRKAHAHGVKVAVLAWGTNSRNSSVYLARHPEKTVDSLLAYVKANNLDGVNIDDETWREKNTETGGSNRELVTRFFRILREKFRAVRGDYHLTYASPGVISPDDKFGDDWIDYAAVAELIDGFTLMSYVMNPPGIGWTGGAQPLRGGGKVGAHARDYATLLQDYLKATGGKKEKLIFGLANDYGGTEWTCRGPEAGARIAAPPRKLTAAEARANAEKHGRRFHPVQRVPWYRYEAEGRWIQGWYEDEESMRAKLEFLREQGIPGICLWVLDAREPAATYRVLREAFVSPRK